MLGEHRKIFLGKKTMKDGMLKNVFLKVRKNGVVVIVSKPRTGKSAMVKEIALRLYEFERPMLILDSMGKGEYESTKKVNYRAMYPQAIEELKVIKNFVLPLNAFNTIEDFVSLGFTDDAASYMYRWMKNKFLHDFKNFDDFLDSLPISSAYVKIFNAEYLEHGIKLRTHIPYQTKGNLISHWLKVKHWFWKGKDDKRMLLDSNVLQRLWKKHKYICLQVDMGSGEEYKSCAYIGNLLKGLDDRFLKKMSPAIIIEEADLLCPHKRLDARVLTSRNVLRYFVNKKLRYNMWIFFVTQNDKLLDEDVVNSAFDKIIGVVDSTSRYWNSAKWNKLQIVKKVPRSDFVYIDVNNWASKFYPKITSCGCQS
jgi:hypothetical protein